jgi:hypothetical protein
MMKILSTSTDISADDASLALKSVLAPKKVATTTTDATSTDEDEEDELDNDEETTRGIMDSAMEITKNIMERWKSNDGTFEISELTSMLEATFAINDEYAAVTKQNAKRYKKPTTASTTATTATTTTTTTAATTSTAATDATGATDSTEVAVVSDYELEKGK